MNRNHEYPKLPGMVSYLRAACLSEMDQSECERADQRLQRLHSEQGALMHSSCETSYKNWRVSELGPPGLKGGYLAQP